MTKGEWPTTHLDLASLRNYTPGVRQKIPVESDQTIVWDQFHCSEALRCRSRTSKCNVRWFEPFNRYSATIPGEPRHHALGAQFIDASLQSSMEDIRDAFCPV